jgi:hypothetical protein
MTARSVTTQVRLLRFGDVMTGIVGSGTVTGLANSFRPENMDVTLAELDTGTSRVATLNRNQWVSVQRNE